ncbi:MAG TPA: inositol monophosphatase family protein [Gemmatimonadaceae bacterium]
MTNRLLLDAVRDVARLMGERALRYFRSGVTVETKADGSEVTAADRETERLGREWIERRFPGESILGEEYGSYPGSAERRWLIDPIDGTRSFVRGVPLWGSMVAVEQDNTVLAGAICCPATGDLVAAAAGEGCWHNDTRAQVSKVSDLMDAVILATDARFPANPERVSRWTALVSEVATARTWGDCYGYVLVATGRAELMVDDRLSPWDVTPLVPIITEAGGVFTDWRGRREPGPDGVATNASLARVLRDRLGVPLVSRGGLP